jgi:hypothetical protein
MSFNAVVVNMFSISGQKWYMPVISATREDGGRNIKVQGQLGQKMLRPCLKNILKAKGLGV